MGYDARMGSRKARPVDRVLALCVAVAAGCGPISYVRQVAFDANHSVEAARAAQADKYSPYWWTRAAQYLHMAREVAGHADYQDANRFGRLAVEAAIKAKEEGELGQRDPSKLPYIHLDEASPAAPAKAKDDVRAPAAPAKAKDDVRAPAAPAKAKDD
jgi:hypothetical protein